MKEGGTKHNKGKPRISLIPAEFIEEMAYVLSFGAEKYDAYNWTKGFNYTELIDAMQRHALKFERGQDMDPETGRSELAAIAINAMFLYMHQKFNLGTDDRWKRPESK